MAGYATSERCGAITESDQVYLFHQQSEVSFFRRATRLQPAMDVFLSFQPQSQKREPPVLDNHALLMTSVGHKYACCTMSNCRKILVLVLHNRESHTATSA